MTRLVLLIARILTFKLSMSISVAIALGIRAAIGPQGYYYPSMDNANTAATVLIFIGLIISGVLTDKVKELITE